MKEYIAEYIVPVEKKGKDCMLDFFNTKPLIRCKDCKHHHRDSQGIPYCENIDYGYGWKDEDYCSRAERREK
jgi:hypothetical protein